LFLAFARTRGNALARGSGMVTPTIAFSVLALPLRLALQRAKKWVN
jgi:hypothetical protein